MNIIKIIGTDVMPISLALAECFALYYNDSDVYVVNDIIGEDHIYAVNNEKKPMFDMLVSSARKFVFVWYYIHPSKGIEMVEDLKKIVLNNGKDFVIKYPNIPMRKTGWPSILRYGKKPAGMMLEKFIVKKGNPQLEEKYYTDEDLNTYRNYQWHNIDNALKKILDKAKLMAIERLRKYPDKILNIKGYCLYAGCAYHMAYPHLGFGMRDIDVQVFFSPEWFTNTRCAFTRHCDIEEFGKPNYFGGKTRWLDLMWNSFHTETGNFNEDVINYLGEMRYKSDRWATISQRPIINLVTKRTIYKPNWLKKLEKEIKL